MFRKKIIPFVTAFAMAFSFAVTPAKAAVEVGTVISGAAAIATIWQAGLQTYELFFAENPNADESEYTGFNPGGIYGGGVGRDELAAAYSTYVSELPVTGVTTGESGYLYNGVALPSIVDIVSTQGTVFDYLTVLYYENGTDSSWHLFNSRAPFIASIKTDYLLFSVDGSTYVYMYKLVNDAWGNRFYDSTFSSGTGFDNTYYTLIWCNYDFYDSDGNLYFAGSDSLYCGNVSEAETEYGITVQSRPTSITGNYGIIGDDGSVTNIGTQTIVNEGDSIYYNPVTNTSYDLSGWTYDYSTRTYDLSTTEGDTITVEYGDETVNITEGDTVYNIYYLIEADTSSGDDEDSSGSTGDEDCDHTYTSETTKAATCLLSGKETFTCSECGDTYTETIPATGHDWSVLQTVTSQYDDTGALITEGYTIYQCSSCGEQYKSTDGSAPPGSSSSSGGTIWEKIGTLFGTIADGVIGMIETAVSTLLDGLISLATTISEKGQRVIELVLGFFEKIPTLFGAFPDFLGAVFPFIPEDFLLILEFGLAAVVFVAVIKFFKKG